MPLQIEKDAARRPNSKIPLCARHCPIRTPISQVIQIFENQVIMRYMEQ